MNHYKIKNSHFINDRLLKRSFIIISKNKKLVFSTNCFEKKPISRSYLELKTQHHFLTIF
ncbi:hypothetical protein FEDK69T_12360 [Flavobacterium enshiense DK69]|nr:hypothetical protein FEDK69T_12360 [Flavobacterium enshiense DK69]